MGRVEDGLGDPAAVAADRPSPGAAADDGGPVRQQPLPLPWQLVRGPAEVDFAHPAECDFSRILTFYRVRWSYEPTTFALAWTDEGRPSEMFTPDFYLPEHRLYIELTTMRQRLVTRKNRKLRRLRELYPNVRIKLLYRRDYHRLVGAYRRPAPGPAGECPAQVLCTAEEIAARTGQLAEEIAAARQGRARSPARPLLVLIVGHGASPFGRDLTRRLAGRGVEVETEQIDLSRFRTPGGVRRVRIRRGPRTAPAGRDVLLVADVVSTGLSLAYLAGWLTRRGARAVDVCALLDRREARIVDVPVRYVGFEAPNELLVGYGLMLRRRFRHLPFIATLPAEEQTVADRTDA